MSKTPGPIEFYVFALTDAKFQRHEISVDDIAPEVMVGIKAQLDADSIPEKNYDGKPIRTYYALTWADDFYRDLKLFEVRASDEDPDPWAYGALFDGATFIIKEFQSAG